MALRKAGSYSKYYAVPFTRKSKVKQKNSITFRGYLYLTATLRYAVFVGYHFNQETQLQVYRLLEKYFFYI